MFITMSAIVPCIFYDSKVKTTKMSKVKLKRENARFLREQTTFVFEVRDGMEGLLHVIDLFSKDAD